MTKLQLVWDVLPLYVSIHAITEQKDIPILPQDADAPAAWVNENVVRMRRFGQLGREILARPVLVFVQAAAPLGAIGHIVDDTLVGNVH
ncbi:MAG: hypothetical protein KDE24_08450, partial [Caldilinea sp.]|nr:hypothetical protein [Caldilinea sp.]